MTTELLTVAEAAKQLKMNPQTIRRWIRSGQLPAIKLGQKEWRISADTLFSQTSEQEASIKQERLEAFEEITALRESLRGKNIPVQKLVAESRRQLERRSAPRRH